MRNHLCSYGWDFDFDKKTTSLYYEEYEDLCNCAICRNFYKNAALLPNELREFLEQFGIIVEKPIELWSFIADKEKNMVDNVLYYAVNGIAESTEEYEIDIGATQIVVMAPKPDDVVKCPEHATNAEIKEPYFVFEIHNVWLPWVVEDDIEKCYPEQKSIRQRLKEFSNNIIINKFEDHSGPLVKKHKSIFGKHIFVINAGIKTVSVIVGEGIYNITKIGDNLKIGHIGKKLVNIQPFELSEEAHIWNRFIEEICSREYKSLSSIQRSAVISLWYDAEMNSGGHSGFFDCYPNISKEELVDSLRSIGADIFVDNYIDAVSSGKDDGYKKTDAAFYSYSPSLTDILEKYVLDHKDEILP